MKSKVNNITKVIEREEDLASDAGRSISSGGHAPYAVSELYFSKLREWFHLITEHHCTDIMCENYPQYIYNIEQTGHIMVTGLEHFINEAYYFAWRCSGVNDSMMMSPDIHDELDLSKKILIFIELFNVDQVYKDRLSQVKNLRNEVDHVSCRYLTESGPCEKINGIIKKINSSLKVLLDFMKHIQENKTFSPGGVICSVDGYTTDENLNKTLDRIINNLDRINPAPEITNKEK